MASNVSLAAGPLARTTSRAGLEACGIGDDARHQSVRIAAPADGLTYGMFPKIQAALPELPYACGLATALLLEGDVVAEPLLPEGGHIGLRRPVPGADALGRWEAGDEERRCLLARWEAAALPQATRP